MNEMFILDELYINKYGIESYPKDGDLLDKFIYYKYKKVGGIDPDASEEVMNIHLKSNLLFAGFQAYTENYAWRKYQIKCNDICYRGDTIFNCMELLLQIAGHYRKEGKNQKIDIDSFKKTEFYTENRKLINKFIYWCYNPGNMCVVPYSSKYYSLNYAKEYLSQPGYKYCLKDSADRYFRVLCDYFTSAQTIGPVEKIVERLEKNDKFGAWRDRYHDNIGQYKDDNCFQPFFEGNSPKQFFVITDKGFEADIKDYMEKVITALKERTKLLLVPEAQKNHL